jgi:hypothetical protein
MADTDQLARWRRDLQQVYDSLMRGAGKEFEAWFEETAMLETRLKRRLKSFASV